MTNEDKELLAKCYMNASKAVKRNAVTVTIEPHGWFKIKYHVGQNTSLTKHTARVRASRLIFGLESLTEQFTKKEVTA
jgi:hypothetical protein